jgi:hypothetical protein
MNTTADDHSSWLAIETRHYGEIFILANDLATAGFLILEAYPLNRQGFLLVDCGQATRGSVDPVIARFNSYISRSAFIEKVSKTTVEAYSGISGSPVEDFLLFLEFDFAGQAIDFCEGALQKGFRVVDLRFLRGSPTVTHLVLTGSDESAARVLANENAVFNPSLVTRLDKNIKRYFDIFP